MIVKVFTSVVISGVKTECINPASPQKYKNSKIYIERALKQSLPQGQLDDLNKLLKKIPTD